MNLVDLVKLLEKQGLDSATAETVAAMAQSKPVDEAKELLESMLGSPAEVAPYIEARKRSALKKLASKPDTQGGFIENGRVKDGVMRNGITVRSESKPHKHRPAKTVESEVPVADRVDLVKDLEAALKKLSVSSDDRKQCDCMGSKHGLLEMAPNCLNCGRIVCNKEGLGPCLFCHQPLLPNEQVNQILQILETQKMDVISTMSKKALAAAGIAAPSTKPATKGTNNPAFTPAAKISQSSAQAEANLDRLLGYQANDSVRTRIIDQAGDVDLPSAGVNRWASAREQAEQLRRQQQQLRRLEHERKARSGLGRKVLSIDVRGNKIYSTLEDEKYVSDNEDEDGDAELIARGDAEPLETTEEPGTTTVRFYDANAFSNQRKFAEPPVSHHSSPAGASTVDSEAHSIHIIRDPDENLAY